MLTLFFTHALHRTKHQARVNPAQQRLLFASAPSGAAAPLLDVRECLRGFNIITLCTQTGYDLAQ